MENFSYLERNFFKDWFQGKTVTKQEWNGWKVTSMDMDGENYFGL